MTQSYDLIVIGGGSGGIAMANRAARYGARTALIAAGPLGGTCVNVGCVPKKIFWNAAHLAEQVKMAKEYGFDALQPQFHWESLKRQRDAYIERLHDRYAQGLDGNGVTLIRNHARFSGTHQITAGDEVLNATHILIATGGQPVWPDIPGAELGITSDGFFALETMPRSVAIVGAGYIAVELAGVLHALGSDVSLVMRRNHFLNDFEPMLRENLMDAMLHQGVSASLPNARSGKWKNVLMACACTSRMGTVLVGWKPSSGPSVVAPTAPISAWSRQILPPTPRDSSP